MRSAVSDGAPAGALFAGNPYYEYLAGRRGGLELNAYATRSIELG